MFGSASVIAVVLKSYVPGWWHVSHRLRTAGYVVSQYPCVGDFSFQVKSTPRFSAPWVLCTKSFMFADQALLVLLGVWQNVQGGAALRCPAWKSGPTPNETWQPLHLELATTTRRAVKPVATIETSGAGTIRPPFPVPLTAGDAFAVNAYFATLVCVSGRLLLMKVGGEPRLYV